MFRKLLGLFISDQHKATLHQHTVNQEDVVQILCKICFNNRDESLVVQFGSCEHSSCLMCMEEYVDRQLDESEITFACPFEGKCEVLDDWTVEKVLDFSDGNDLKEKLEKRQLQHALLDLNDLMECSSPECENKEFSDTRLVEADYRRGIKERLFSFHPARKFKYKGGGVDLRKYTCNQCRKSVCLICKRDWKRGIANHSQVSCKVYEDQHERWLKKIQEQEKKTKSHVEEFSTGSNKLYERCPTCNILTERIAGCPHMTCRCGTDFCFWCGLVYPYQCNTACERPQ